MPAPAGERWRVTDISARSEVAVAESGTPPRSGVPGSPSETATPLKAGEAANAVAAWSEPPTTVPDHLPAQERVG